MRNFRNRPADDASVTGKQRRERDRPIARFLSTSDRLSRCRRDARRSVTSPTSYVCLSRCVLASRPRCVERRRAKSVRARSDRPISLSMSHVRPVGLRLIRTDNATGMSWPRRGTHLVFDRDFPMRLRTVSRENGRAWIPRCY